MVLVIARVRFRGTLLDIHAPDAAGRTRRTSRSAQQVILLNVQKKVINCFAVICTSVSVVSNVVVVRKSSKYLKLFLA